MRWKQIEDEPKAFALIFETGDEIAGVLQQFSKGQGLGGSSLKPLALSYAKLGWFNWETRKYDPACVLDEQVELLSLYRRHRPQGRRAAGPRARRSGRLRRYPPLTC
jgi:hypothetical protein